ncbi:hypothetical protein Golob_006239 [Gossypium lobatum]|uniref:Endonuclease/exonuclease/phosphatase domain-containing protein n=1 Tax=Gossypium lobatum TaxID=34289 RepID=A0A7J8MVR1_9ROSI|nr:hypothetical protein [Gossypium lobatum]
MVVLNDSKLDLGKHLAVVFKENANPNNGEALGDDIIDKSGKFFSFFKARGSGDKGDSSKNVPLTESLNSMVELINAQLDMEISKGLKALKGKHTLGSGNSKHIPWVTIGDFNAILSSSNKKGGHKDLGFKGPDFMWHRDDLYERLDRAISNDTWLRNFPMPFQISGYWVEHPSFPNFVKENWCLKGNMVEALNIFTRNIKEWNNSVYGFIGIRKRKFM